MDLMIRVEMLLISRIATNLILLPSAIARSQELQLKQCICLSYMEPMSNNRFCRIIGITS